jgi:uncharacterized membrane-anchored protein
MKSNSSETNSSFKSPEVEFSEKVTFRDYLIASEQKPKKTMPLSRLIVPLLIQTGIIFAVPFQAAYTHVTGRTVVLQTAPVNTFDFQRNDAVTMNYDISRNDSLKKLPGWNQLVRQNPGRNKRFNPLAEGTTLYVIMQEQQASRRGIPRVWRPIRVTGNSPTSLPANQIPLKGIYQDGEINYGFESYYIPEDQREQINRNISQAQRIRGGQRQPIFVQVKVDPQGKGVPIGMWVRDGESLRKYRF